MSSIQTFEPDPEVEVSSVDGRVRRTTSSESWATIRGGAGVTANDSAVSMSVEATASTTTDEYALLQRIFTLFDISAIPTGSVIKTVDYKLRGSSKVDNLGVSGYVVDSPAPASDTALVAGDYDIGGWVDAAHSNVLAHATISTSSFNTWTLNAVGIALVQAALDSDGIVKLGLRLLNDLDNSAPTWSSGGNSSIIVQSAEGANPPQLVVTFAPAARGTPIYY